MTQQELDELKQAKIVDIIKLPGVDTVMERVTAALQSAPAEPTVIALALLLGSILSAMTRAYGSAHAENWHQRFLAFFDVARAEADEFNRTTTDAQVAGIIALDALPITTKH